MNARNHPWTARAVRFLAGALLALGLVAAVAAQSFPARPIRIIAPFPPGGPTDILARLVALKMGETFRQQVIVENRPGANGIIGTELAARAPADGYTLLMAVDSILSMSASLYEKLPYDPAADFTPVTLVATVACVLVANNGFPAKTVQDVIALAKAKPGEINVGAGTITTQLSAHLFNSMAGTKMVLVPYKGGGNPLIALLGGEVPMLFASAAQVVPSWRAGKLKLLAVLGRERLASLPEIPTVAESGVPGYDVSIWQSLMLRSGTAPEIIGRLNAEVVRIIALPEVRERLLGLGLLPATGTPGEAAAFIRAETAKWGKVIRDNSFKVE